MTTTEKRAERKHDLSLDSCILLGLPLAILSCWTLIRYDRYGAARCNACTKLCNAGPNYGPYAIQCPRYLTQADMDAESAPIGHRPSFLQELCLPTALRQIEESAESRSQESSCFHRKAKMKTYKLRAPFNGPVSKTRSTTKMSCSIHERLGIGNRSCRRAICGSMANLAS